MNPNFDTRIADQDATGDAPPGHVHVIAVPAAPEIQLGAEFVSDQVNSPPRFFDPECVLASYSHRLPFRKY